MSETRAFSLGQVLSITTDRLCCDIGGVYEILNFMTRDNLMTHQLPRAMRECAPWLLRQHPALAAVDASGVTPENWQAWLAEQEMRFGSSLAVAPIPQDDHTRRDPVDEAVAMFGADRVIAVQPESAP